MISFSVKNDVVTLTIWHGAPVEKWTSGFKYTTHSEFHATLMADNLENELRRRLEKIRREEYERGWNDAKKKNPKCDYFYGCF